MPEQGELIVNASYADLFGDTTHLRRDSFVIPKLVEFSELNNALQTKALALWLAVKDITAGVIYGIEITSNGGERQSRIPLVRIDTGAASIWKLVSSIKDVERGVAALDQLIYFLQQQGGVSVPVGVLVLCDDEKVFATPSSEHNAFVQRIAAEHKLIVISFGYLEGLIARGEVADLSGLLKKGPHLYTTGTL